jgi:hypothetical protein
LDVVTVLVIAAVLWSIFRWLTALRFGCCRRSVAKMLTKDEARRIAANVAKLPGAVAEGITRQGAGHRLRPIRVKSRAGTNVEGGTLPSITDNGSAQASVAERPTALPPIRPGACPMPSDLNDRTSRVSYALHVRGKNGQQIDYNRRDELPKVGELIAVVLSDEPISIRVMNVITAPARELAELVHYVYAVEA